MKRLSHTSTQPVVVVFANGVKRAVYVEASIFVKRESVPPEARRAESVKFVDGSVSRNVTVAVSPIFKVDVLQLIATVGAIVSTLTLLKTYPFPLTFQFPARSVNVWS